MNATLTITLPGLPPKECSPNARVHPLARAGHTAGYRLYVKLHARDQIRKQTGKWCALTYARLDITFIVPDRRRRDKTNLASAFKAGLDGLVDAGLIQDDSWEHCDDQYHVRYEKGVSQTIVEVKEGA
jgi:Holliday junction resolvase RusA-like endonuclease